MGPKHCLKSKTNLVQVPVVGLLIAALVNPDIQGLICRDGNLLVWAQLVLTLLARNVRSNLFFRKRR